MTIVQRRSQNGVVHILCVHICTLHELFPNNLCRNISGLIRSSGTKVFDNIVKISDIDIEPLDIIYNKELLHIT